MPISKGIRARIGYSKESHHDFLLRLRTAYKGVFKNPNFPKVPIDMALFGTKIEQYSDFINATMSGAKIAFLKRDSLRKELEGMLMLLSTYVEHVADNDPAIFTTAGIEAVSNTYATPQPLEKPMIPKVKQCPYSGQVQIWMPRSLRKIKRWDSRHAEIDAEGNMTGEWVEDPPITGSLRPTTISGLKPGTRYAFQLRLLGKLGVSDWSDSATLICT